MKRIIRLVRTSYVATCFQCGVLVGGPTSAFLLREAEKEAKKHRDAYPGHKVYVGGVFVEEVIDDEALPRK